MTTTTVEAPMRKVPALPSLTVVDAALMLSLNGGVDKQRIALAAQKIHGDIEVTLYAASTALQRLIDLGLVGRFGDDYVVTPRGKGALAIFRDRVSTMFTYLNLAAL